MIGTAVAILSLLTGMVGGGAPRHQAEPRHRAEPLAPCHSRASGYDNRGHWLVAYADHTTDTALSAQVAAAARMINKGLRNVQLLANTPADIEISETTTGPVGVTVLHCVVTSGTATIALNGRLLTSSSVTPHTVLLVVAHEFGHALGLAHTDEPCALMHPTNGDCSQEEQIRFTRAEQAAIDGLYTPAPPSAARSSAVPPPVQEQAPPDPIIPAPWPRG